MVRFTSKLTLVLGLCAALALANTANHAAADIRSDIICRNGACYPRVFRPTTEFQEVLEGQEIPGGLHVQMDFETHRKFAKLMDPEIEASSKKDATNSILVIDTDSPGTIQKHQVGGGGENNNMPPPIDLKHPDGELTSEDSAQMEENSRMNLQTVFDSIPELANLKDNGNQQQQQQKQETKPPVVPLFKGNQGDHQTFTEQMEILKTNKDPESLLSAMEELADLASDMEFGLRLTNGEDLKTLVGFLGCKKDNTEAECHETRLLRSKSALIIGNAVQNHEKAQSAGYKNSLHKTLLTHLETETDAQVLRRLIFAYGSLVRGSSSDKDFIQDEDISRLAKIYSKSTDPLFRRKCIYVMSDFADPDMQFISPNNDTDTDNIQSGEKHIVTNVQDDNSKNNHTKTMTVIEKVAPNVGPWCESLQQENQSSEGRRENSEKDGDWEIIERAVELLHASYPETCVLVNDRIKDEL
ncbi:hypothetical protein BX616_001749 [Lobosporangium transversale]|uniref:Nucleotide exchange factor SIL1 n=1 Tax=Lobosporangium transversale TaxID=64571 RepID=A0A1Y2H1F5_9FUNG|nr:hypothetical protein BCR41DRAFT_418450 [Lobosporangium transversale]KAF9902977.1 hypothetical protein BX616_001749 [Lobosporangium transversale]ORZ28365.1 hypothetical protein BCR41DRAFT_418450 [Lobosporangium transversale]|eukprot:XP_021886050.1 hypothetical protein BCR41DRAFT_418450 [Lobosporangium transversale]